eukprot:CAMPEP_0116088416 /NCGR_PEP_ID=MMETSP0327-20121206/5861_1 /TAXON_ID=44447 /ORGANISM="Pseudo-nitzschia delicatissima, Strain B596" /LENGTH=34 /DNA_ID= /DNA_START= /DNA_END= /DNA_ORIENTATION=
MTQIYMINGIQIEINSQILEIPLDHTQLRCPLTD